MTISVEEKKVERGITPLGLKLYTLHLKDSTPAVPRVDSLTSYIIYFWCMDSKITLV